MGRFSLKYFRVSFFNVLFIHFCITPEIFQQWGLIHCTFCWTTLLLLLYVWNAALREMLKCGRKLTNEKYRHALAIEKSGMIAGHAKNISSIDVCSFLLRWQSSVVQLWKGSFTHLIFKDWKFNTVVFSFSPTTKCVQQGKFLDLRYMGQAVEVRLYSTFLLSGKLPNGAPLSSH